jgi:hypothetical protein
VVENGELFDGLQELLAPIDQKVLHLVFRPEWNGFMK